MSTIDEIMNKPPNDLVVPDDIDILVAYHRNNRARVEAGEKPKKDRPKITVDMSSIIQQIKPTATPDKPKFVRRV